MMDVPAAEEGQGRGVTHPDRSPRSAIQSFSMYVSASATYASGW